jgi:hypothetical protein
MCWRVRAPQGRPVIAVMGDSTAMALDPGFVDMARRRGWGYVLAAKQGCGVSGLAYMLHYPSPPRPGQAKCAMKPDRRLHQVLDTYRPSMVFALSNFETLAYVKSDGAVAVQLTPEWSHGMSVALRHVAHEVTRSGAVFVTPGVLAGANNNRGCVAYNSTNKVCATTELAAVAAVNAANGVYRHVAKDVPDTHIIPMQRIICPGGSCPMVVDGLVIRYDGIHFTPDGARWFVNKMKPLLPDPRRSSPFSLRNDRPLRPTNGVDVVATTK